MPCGASSPPPTWPRRARAPRAANAAPAPASDLEAQVAHIAAETVTREPAATAPGSRCTSRSWERAACGASRCTWHRCSSTATAARVDTHCRDRRPRARRAVGTLPQVAFGRAAAGGLSTELWTPADEQARPRTIVQLVLAELLPSIARVVLLPLPSVASADVAELAGLDLGGRAVAARAAGTAISGFEVIHAAALRLGRRAGRRRPTCGTLRTRAMRSTSTRSWTTSWSSTSSGCARDRFADEALRLVQAYGLH